MRAQRLESIGTLTGGIAHDLNNVQSPIPIAIEVLKQSAANESTFRILETLEMSAKRGSEIVKKAPGFARGLEGKHMVLDIRLVIKEMSSMMEQTFPNFIMDGAQTILALRKINPHLKIIASSGLISDKAATVDSAATFDAFIKEPYAADRLLRALHEVLNAGPH